MTCTIPSTNVACGKRARSERSSARRWQLSAFGLEVDADFSLPAAHECTSTPSSGPDVTFGHARRDELAGLASEARTLRYLQSFDDCPFAMLEGPAGDVLFHYGPRALFHLSADRRVLRCAPTVDDDPAWQRVLLDTVLWTISLLRGFELLHASAVETSAGVVAFVASSGGGKSTMATEYLRRGAQLFCDDILALDNRDGGVVGYPGLPLMNVPRHVSTDSLSNVRVVGEFHGEHWLQVEVSRLAAGSLRTIVLIERVPGVPASCSRVDATSLTLLPYAIGFPHLGGRARRRFELFSAVASTTPVFRLSADPAVPPAVLADLVEDRIQVG